jgi:hypothetical protein
MPRGLEDVSKYPNLVCIHHAFAVFDTMLLIFTPLPVLRAHFMQVGLGCYVSRRTCRWEPLVSDGGCRAGHSSDAERWYKE